MDIEKEISRRVLETGYSRLDIIASMNLGRRSEAAQRASQNRTRRKELMDSGMSFETACLVVNKENKQELGKLKTKGQTLQPIQMEGIF